MKTRRTIALCLEYPLGQMGGMEVLVQQLALGFPETIDLVLVSKDRSLAEVPIDYRHRFKAHFYWSPEEASPFVARTLVENLRQAGVDLVHFHLGGNYSWETHKFWHCPVFYCRRKKMPYLLTTHKVFPVLMGYSKPWRWVSSRVLLLAKAWLSRAIILRNTPLELTVSKHDAQAMKRIFPPWRTRFRHLYHSRLSLTNGLENAPTSPPRQKVILCAGTVCELKGHHVLLRAFTRIAPYYPDWTIELVGRRDEGPFQKELDRLIAALPNPKQIRYAGVISDFALLRDRFRTAAICVQPSLVEGLGLAIQEALSLGCPAIGSDVGGIPEMIKSGLNGLLVPANNVEALAAALNRLMGDDELRQKMGRAAPAEIQRLRMTREDMISQYLEIYDSLLAKAQAA